MLIAVALFSGGVGAQSTYRFDLPSQPLEQALTAFSERTGLQMLYDSELARGRQSTAISGQYEPREALALMLAESGLAARFTAAGAVVIYAGSSSAVTLSPLTAVAAPVIGGAADGPAARAYAATVQALITERLRRSPELGVGDYGVSIRLWVGPEGGARRVEFLSGSDDPHRDEAFAALIRSQAFPAPPEGLPQPMRIAFRVRRGG
ncbi:secretin and TonB N-terminal domain-containing protein [Brevundimonas sp. GCM10030266]|uniref:secretin and TonB N-terminal domain-containing protein n=1 Tax=Brevundimonas sp. GCM10030266 TaxID=3273386 RepID=UPI0036110C6F